MILALSTSNAVIITDEYISGSGIASGYGEGYYTEFCFENYCPLCGSHGTLDWNPKGTYEGEITCSHCDADFSVSGRDKNGGGARAWLYYYEIPEPEPEPVSPPEPVPQPQPEIITGHILGEPVSINMDLVKAKI